MAKPLQCKWMKVSFGNEMGGGMFTWGSFQTLVGYQEKDTVTPIVLMPQWMYRT